jgi:hypothetical protein
MDGAKSLITAGVQKDKIIRLLYNKLVLKEDYISRTNFYKAFRGPQFDDLKQQQYVIKHKGKKNKKKSVTEQLDTPRVSNPPIKEEANNILLSSSAEVVKKHHHHRQLIIIIIICKIIIQKTSS